MTQAITCPGCQQQIAIDDSLQQNQLNQLQTQIQQLENEPKAPSFIPGLRCTDGNCEQIHENPRYTTRPKGKCNNCDQFSPTKEGKCSWCKEKDSIEEIDKDELKDFGVRMPNEY